MGVERGGQRRLIGKPEEQHKPDDAARMLTLRDRDEPRVRRVAPSPPRERCAHLGLGARIGHDERRGRRIEIVEDLGERRRSGESAGTVRT